jgi:hypothetical protein
MDILLVGAVIVGVLYMNGSLKGLMGSKGGSKSRSNGGFMGKYGPLMLVAVAALLFICKGGPLLEGLGDQDEILECVREQIDTNVDICDLDTSTCTGIALETINSAYDERCVPGGRLYRAPIPEVTPGVTQYNGPPMTYEMMRSRGITPDSLRDCGIPPKPACSPGTVLFGEPTDGVPADTPAQPSATAGLPPRVLFGQEVPYTAAEAREGVR